MNRNLIRSVRKKIKNISQKKIKMIERAAKTKNRSNSEINHKQNKEKTTKVTRFFFFCIDINIHTNSFDVKDQAHIVAWSLF